MISYQVEREIDPAAVADLFRRSGIRRPVYSSMMTILPSATM